jgi:hypothetical protein
VWEIKDRRQSGLEKLLRVFDQSNISEDHRILNNCEGDRNEEYRALIRSLQRASLEIIFFIRQKPCAGHLFYIKTA